MNILLEKSVGIDYWIQGLQTKLFNRFIPIWGISEAKWNSRGRVYVNRVEDGYLPQAYPGKGTDYTNQMLFDDNYSVSSFFTVFEPEKVVNGETHVTTQLYFFANLSEITPSGYTTTNPQRLDDAFVNDIHNYIRLNGTGNFTVKSIIKKVDKVLDGFSGEVKRKALLYDMQPRFCIRFDLTFLYNSYLNS